MSIRTIQLNISSDIFDKVISFLEILPKNKIEIIDSNLKKSKVKRKATLSEFFQSSPLVGIEIERNSEIYNGRIEF